jgi:opacity protein-like surface antigen
MRSVSLKHVRDDRRRSKSSHRVQSAFTLLLCLGILLSSQRAYADKSTLPPEVGYNYQEIETPRITATNGATRALSSSTEALFDNPANMSAARVYHLTALAQIWPESGRQSYGAAAVDSVGSSARVAGGLGATYNTQDTDGINRKWTDVRFALSYPFSDKFYLGLAGRYLTLSQNGLGPLGSSAASSGLAGKHIVQGFSFDAGATIKPTEGLSLAIVGTNLNNPGNGFQPMGLGGGIGFGQDSFSLEADIAADFTTWDRTTARAMAGGEVLLGDHFPVRAGYRYDDGAKSHSVSGGVGYVDTTYGAEIAFRRVVSGDPVTAIVFGFSYHLDSGGLTQTDGGDSF